jgi:hypothetical protein
MPRSALCFAPVLALGFVSLPALAQGARERTVLEDEAPSDPVLLDNWTIDSAQLLLVPYGRDVRDVESAAFSAPRAGRDPFGLHIAGASSPETNRFIEGLRVDGPAFGLAGTLLPVDFIDRLEIQSAGARADQPFGTGGAEDVYLKTGTDEFHGSVFAHFSPYEAERRNPPVASALTARTHLDDNLDFGAELAGPLVRRRLWFYAGLVPQIASQSLDRIVSAQTDSGNGNPVRDANGNPAFHEVGRSTYSRTATSLLFAGKLTWLVAPDHQISLSVFGDPGRSSGANGNPFGNEGGLLFDTTLGSQNAVLRYRGSFGATSLETFLGYHRETAHAEPSDVQGVSASALADTPQTFVSGVRNLLDPLFLDDPTVPAVQKSQAVRQGCAILITGFNPCPVSGYLVGGAGALDDATAARLAFGAKVTHRISLAGLHLLSYGVDGGREVSDITRTFSGGAVAALLVSGIYDLVSYGHPDPAAPGLPEFAPAAGTIRLAGNTVRSRTRNVTLAAFVEDSWIVFDRLRLDAGLRLQRQLLHAEDSIVSASGAAPGSQVDVSTLLPRFGITYDVLGGHGLQAFASYSRTSEIMPLDLADRGFGPPEVVQLRTDPNNCERPSDPRTCAIVPNAFGGGQTFRFAGGSLAESVSPDLGPQIADQFAGGLEARLAPGARVRVSYLHAELSRAVEDTTPDDGATFVVTNPGVTSPAALALPAARRVYDAFTAAASKRFDGRWLLAASYTLASLRGNYAGLFSANNLELRPHWSTEFDTAALMVNRDGPLPGDTRHAFRLDGAYAQPLGNRLRARVGASLRADSGAPLDTLGANAPFGPDQTFILPRGSAGRLPWTWQLDLRFALEAPIAGTVTGVSLDVINATNNREVIAVDQTYTRDAVSPVATPQDLPSLRNASGQSVALNPGFLSPTAYQLPLQLRLGARVAF